jgi:YesN/AraC family two-component response regulator
MEKLPETIKALYTILDSSLTIGVSQVISAVLPGGRRAGKTGETEGETFRILDHYIRESKTDQIRGFFSDFLEKCRRERCPQLWVEKSMRRMFEMIRFQLNTQPNKTVSGDEPEFILNRTIDLMIDSMIEDAFFYAANYDELKESFQDILDQLLQDQSEHIRKVDTPEFFGLIKEYISLHLAEPLTLQAMCGHFGISQTYISRLFRKYSGQSFINYLTGVRIEKAKQYLGNQDMLIKDIAPMVGFSDQFYFSRVFRSLTGQAPSKYQEC